MLVHASCVARDGDAVLLLGPSGAGKSDLALRLLRLGWQLVADDQVMLQAEAGTLQAAAPAALHGMLEVRGLGLFTGLAAAAAAPLRLAVQLAPRAAIQRLPEPACWTDAGVAVPKILLHAFDASAPDRVALALDAALGHARQASGAFRA